MSASDDVNTMLGPRPTIVLDAGEPLEEQDSHRRPPRLY